jgi:hypothetical protein
MIAMLASGGALYVSMKLSGALSTFRSELMRELDDRYVRMADHLRIENTRRELEDNYREGARSSLKNVEVEVRRDKDDITILLKGILGAILESRDIAEKKRGRP